MSMIFPLASALDITATGPQTAILLNESPFMGGGGKGGGTDGRNAILALAGAVGGSGVVLIEGHDGTDTPDEESTDWFTVETLNAASPLRQEILLPRWIRVNVDTAGTGTLTAHLEGVQ